MNEHPEQFISDISNVLERYGEIERSEAIRLGYSRGMSEQFTTDLLGYLEGKGCIKSKGDGYVLSKDVEDALARETSRLIQGKNAVPPMRFTAPIKKARA